MTANATIFPTQLQRVPPGCNAKAITVTAQTGLNTYDAFDFAPYYDQGKIDHIESVFIDNSANASPFTVTMNGTQQAIMCPANAQGWFNVIATGKPSVQFYTAGGVNVVCVFVNVAMPAQVWRVL